MAEYDSIAQSYQIARKIILSLSEIYTYFNLLGDITGKSILELGCGEGFHTRKLKQQGAKRVLGVDISEQMIELARQQETKEPLGIEYLIKDVSELGQVGEFDLVAATFLLNHAQTKEQLLAFCQNIFINLKTGGRFVAINNNLELLPQFYPCLEKYGRKQRIIEPYKEGSPIVITLFTPTDECTFVDYYLSQATYEWAFQQAGFKTVTWHPTRVSPEDLQKWGQAFWQDFLDHPCFVVIEGFSDNS